MVFFVHIFFSFDYILSLLDLCDDVPQLSCSLDETLVRFHLKFLLECISLISRGVNKNPWLCRFLQLFQFKYISSSTISSLFGLTGDCEAIATTHFIMIGTQLRHELFYQPKLILQKKQNSLPRCDPCIVLASRAVFGFVICFGLLVFSV